MTVGCSSDSEPTAVPAGGAGENVATENVATENVATPIEEPAGQTPAAVEEETSVTTDQPTTLADLAAGLLYDTTETLEFTTIDGLSPPCVWHFVRDAAVIDDPGVSIFELGDGSLVVGDATRVINTCFFDGGELPSAEAMARVLTTSGQLGGFTVLVDESAGDWARLAGLDFVAPALAEDGDDQVLTFQALNGNDFSVIQATARRSADGTFSIDSTRHEG